MNELLKRVRQSGYFMMMLFVTITSLLTGCGTQPTDTLFDRLESSDTGIDFNNQVIESEQLNILDYMYLYNGGGIGLGDFNNDGLLDMYFTANQLENKLYLNEGNLEFKDITASANVGGEAGPNKWKTGVTVVDINEDGWLDIYTCEIDSLNGFKGQNKLYINNHDLTFTDQAEKYGLAISNFSQHSAFFDYDNDGDLDMYLLNQSTHSPASYKRAENRTTRNTKAGDKLYRNDAGRYTDVSEAAGIYGSAIGYGLAVSVGDMNNDKWPDIYVSNDFHENDYLYYNNGDGTFKENIIGSLGHVSTFSMGSDIADINNDALLDVITLDMKPIDPAVLKQSSGVDSYGVYTYKLNFGYHYQYPRNMLHINAGHLFGDKEVQFSEVGQLTGLSTTDWSWSGLVADFNNDGEKDVFISNGIPRRPNDLDFIKFFASEPEKADSLPQMTLIEKMPNGYVSNKAYQNKGNLIFEDVSKSWGVGEVGVSNGTVYGDLDNDGDLDLVINNLNAKASVYKNQAVEKREGRFIKIHLHGEPLNQQGIGARVTLFYNGEQKIQEKYASKGWLSSVMDDLVFGIGKWPKADSVLVVWGNNGQQVIKEVPGNSLLTVDFKDASPETERPRQREKFFANVTESSGIDFEHRENNFNDFSIERLMPGLLSKEGPRISVADLNNDGLDDFFVGGAKGQPGQVYLQNSKSTPFKKMTQPALDLHKECEDVGSVFLDVDNDHDLDLYVVSGGGEPDQTLSIQDRLYINTGSGVFKFEKDRIPTSYQNGSCVVSGDFNNDGYADLFVGGRSVPHEYGLPGVSQLLINNGKGYFKDSTILTGDQYGRLGMVTSAVWLSNERKLVVAGEWMPITIFDFNSRPASKTELPNSNGLWTSLLADDLDGDGDIDLLAGNKGLNSDWQASAKYPLDLYVDDMDGNTSFDPLISYYIDTTRWLYNGFDELAEQLPTLRRRYTSYQQYGADNFDEVFPENIISKSYHKHVNELRSVMILREGVNGFVIKPLPIQAQFSTVYGFATGYFDDDDLKDVLLVGNFDGSPPRMGRADASFGAFLKGLPNNGFESMNLAETGFYVYGEARDVKLLNAGSNNPYVFVSRNNAIPKLFQMKTAGRKSK